MREACCVAFREAIFAEALDLVEAAHRKIGIVATRNHPPHHHILQLMHHAPAAKGCHCFSQPVGFGTGEFRGVERDLHRLLLENRHAKRAREDAGKLVRRTVFGRRCRNFHRFRTAPPLEIGVHHVPLDRAGPDNRDLDHQIIEFARSQPRQHVHLRPAFNLEHAERIPTPQHGVSLRVFARNRGQCQRAAMMHLQQVKAFPDAGEHAQRQHIDLENAQRFDVILVPFDEAAIGHGAITDRHGFGKRAFCQDKSADMLRKVTRHADHLLGQLDYPPQVRITDVHACLGDVFFADLAPVTAPYGTRERAGYVLTQPHRLAHFADCHARAVMDHRRT